MVSSPESASTPSTVSPRAVFCTIASFAPSGVPDPFVASIVKFVDVTLRELIAGAVIPAVDTRIHALGDSFPSCCAYTRTYRH